MSSRLPRILHLSSRPAADTTSGALLLHRHFSLASSRFEFVHAHDDPSLPEDEHHHRVALPRLYARLQNTRWFPFFWSLNHGLGCSASPAFLDRLCARVQPEAILTVAEGPLLGAARRLARRRRLPLVTVYHDWLSTWLPAPGWVKRLADRQFRTTYRAAAVNLCVSRALRAELGPHRDAWFLPPIPDPAAVLPTGPAPDPAGFTAACAGVVHGFHRHEIERLALALDAAGTAACLRVYAPRLPTDGPFVSGPPAVRAAYGGFLKGPAFDAALAAASVLVVTSPFHPEWQRIARFSFPSKIPEYCRCAKPILVWAPADSVAADWARRSSAALLVSDPDPAAAVVALARLRGSAELRRQLASAALACARGQFSAARLQSVFESALTYPLGRRPRPAASELD